MKQVILVFATLLIFNHSVRSAETAQPVIAKLTAQSFSLDKLKGKVVYLDFWASWCIPCRQSFPWLNTMRAKYNSDQLVIIAVNLDKEKALAIDFLKRYPADFTILFDPQAVLAKQFQIPGMPSSLLFDKQGKVFSVHSGFFSKKITEYEAELQQLISAN